MAYDSGIVSFTTKTNKVDLVDASHINSVQTELVTIETILGTNVKGDRADLKTRLNNALDADGSLLSGSAYPSPALASQGFFKTDVDVFYIRNSANSTWLPQGVSLSNYLFQYQGQVDQQGVSQGEYSGTSLVPNGQTGNYRFLQADGAGAGVYTTVWTTRLIKTSGVNTVTVHARIWVQNNATRQGNIKVDVGGQNANVSGTLNQITPEWVSLTIDISSLTNGNVYAVTVSLSETTGSAIEVFCSNVIGFGS